MTWSSVLSWKTNADSIAQIIWKILVRKRFKLQLKSDFDLVWGITDIPFCQWKWLYSINERPLLWYSSSLRWKKRKIIIQCITSKSLWLKKKEYRSRIKKRDTFLRACCCSVESMWLKGIGNSWDAYAQDIDRQNKCATHGTDRGMCACLFETWWGLSSG